MHCHCTAVVIQCPPNALMCLCLWQLRVEIWGRVPTCGVYHFLAAWSSFICFSVANAWRNGVQGHLIPTSACAPHAPCRSGHAFHCFSCRYSMLSLPCPSILYGITPRLYQHTALRMYLRVTSFKLHRNSLVIDLPNVFFLDKPTLANPQGGGSVFTFFLFSFNSEHVKDFP